MDVIRFGSIRFIIAGLGSCLFLTGCSESAAYIEYASLPSPLPAEKTPAFVDQAATKLQQNEASDSDAVTDNAGKPTAENPAVSIATPSMYEPQAAVTDDGVDKVAETVFVAAGTAGSATDTKLTSADLNEMPKKPLTAGDLQPAGSTTSTDPREIKLLIPEKRFQPEGAQEALRISYDDIDLLKVLNMEPVPADAVDYFPQWLKDLNGKRVRLRGFMYPTFEATGLTGFALARDNSICCFGRDPLVYDILEVSLAEGETTNYIEAKAFDVEGVFQIDPAADDKELFQLYRIEDARVLK